MSTADGALSDPRDDVRFSQCDIWQRQSAFYERENIAAWSGQVPFYATSNPCIANSYAHVLVRFMQDYSSHPEYQPRAPFYIVELGAGSGTFSFYLIRRLIELQRMLRLQHVRFVYVMTDLVAATVKHWRDRADLKSYADQGLLDFAVYDAEVGADLHLQVRNVRLQRTLANGNPVIVLANYIFDSLSQDVFRVRDGVLEEGLTRRSGHADEAALPSPVFAYREAEFPYYPGEEGVDFDRLLRDYAGGSSGNLLFPIGSLRCIRRLIELSNGRLLLMASDKGYAHHLEVFRPLEPSVVLHGSFSMMVNFDAIGKYFRLRAGDCVHQTQQQGILTSVFTAGQGFDCLPETMLAISDWLQDLGPGNLFTLYTQLSEARTPHSLESVVALLSVFRRDPHLWRLFGDLVPELAKIGPRYALDDLAQAMEEIAANVYPLAGGFDAFASIGLFFQDMGQHRRALDYYGRSEVHFGRKPRILYNRAICHYALGEKAAALELFNAVVAANPEDMMARGWASKLAAEPRPEAMGQIAAPLRVRVQAGPPSAP